MWRRVSRATEPRLFFRAWVYAYVEAHEFPGATSWDIVACKSLERLVRSWVAPDLLEFCLDDAGRPAAEQWARVIRTPYEREFDINLGGMRANTLSEQLYPGTWTQLCQQAGEAALQLARTDLAFNQRIAQAQRDAAEYFELSRARLRMRNKSRGTGGVDVDLAMRELQHLHDAVDAALATPSLKIDTLGVYVLSDQAIRQR
jgi:hypothetical protein